jgi:hypothetical protein
MIKSKRKKRQKESKPRNSKETMLKKRKDLLRRD